VQATVGPLPALRGKLVEALAVPFGGDQLVAEYLLLHLLSSVYGRVDTRSLGRLLLNVTGCPRAGPDDYVAPAGAAPPGAWAGAAACANSAVRCRSHRRRHLRWMRASRGAR